ncbi:SDR family oxidoreductase [Planotetraspora kaengkrachanensis]|uniref:Short-chain dehydrogenase n=1 Tax=Planotetraspora kaengkrachanensis TaxID=575193 RepID=A0A8J3M4S4_9ACTN|nr:SDR family oxidoreductase [Planotetraspora kaengkrachanensis]GIG79449.1 short-chain dehydrogenase [Planotetraspora kaengkrachanensis]
MTVIEGAAVLVTGGRRGLGQAFVAEFLNLGATKVYATSRRPVPAGDDRIEPVALDVTDERAVAALARHARDVSIVVNNAGLPARGPIVAEHVANVEAVFATNVFGPLRVAQHFAPVLAANGGGALVNIHSALSWAAGAGAYGASKAALWSVTNALRVELAGQGTQVLGVHFGYTDTEMTSSLAVVKNDPRRVARDVLIALTEGKAEVLVDDVSRRFKAALSGPVEGLSWTVVDGEVVLGHRAAERGDG